MKNLKKLLPVFAFVLGLGLVFTQSAFKNTSEYTFYNTTGVESSDPADYVYDDRVNVECELLVSSACSATWSNSIAPTLNSHPDGEKISETDDTGKYIPGTNP